MRGLLVVGSMVVGLLALVLTKPPPCSCVRRLAASPRQDAPALPVAFVENRGQWVAKARFAAAFDAVTAWIETAALTLDLQAAQGGRGTVARLAFVAPRAGLQPEGEQPQPGLRHFQRASGAVRDVVAFAQLRWSNVWPGIDVVAKVSGRELEYDLELRGRADLRRAQWRVDGVERFELATDGALLLHTAHGTVRQPRPRTWATMADGARVELDCSFRLHEGGFGFEVPQWDGVNALTIDPGVQWSVRVAGSQDDNGHDAVIDRNGDVLVAGSTLSSTDFPTTLGAYDRSYNGFLPNPWPIGDGMVAKLRGSDGQLLWATYIGGSENDYLRKLAVFANGDVAVSGWTTSMDFPVTPGAFDTSYNGTGLGYLYGGGDIFVSRLSADGANLVWSTFLGGNDLEYALSVAVGGDDAVTLSGHTHSADFPTTAGAFSRSITGGSDTYVVRFDANGALQFSTYYGGLLGEEYGYAIGVDPAGNTTVAGGTDSPDLPVTPGAFDTTYNGGPAHEAECFVARFNPVGGLLWCTFLGGSGDETVYGLALDTAGVVTVTGQTNSPGFPVTPGAYATTHRGKNDLFVTRFDPSGSALLWSTFVGGSDDDRGEAIQADGSGGVFVAGLSASTDVPTTPGSFDVSPNGQWDAIVLHLDAAGQRLLYATVIGGQSGDWAYGLSVHASGSVVATGTTYSFDFPALPSQVGGGDAWAALLDMQPVGAVRFGSATAGCVGLPYAAVSELPRIGSPAFALRSSRAPALGVGVCVLAAARLTTPLSVLGAALWIDPSAPLVVLPAVADVWGGGELALPIPLSPGLVGSSLHAQWFWADACSLSATSGLTITIQP